MKDSAKELLSAALIDIIDNCMKTVSDQSGTIYNLPNFMINDPLYIKEYDKLKNNEVAEIKLIVKYFFKIFRYFFWMFFKIRNIK